MKNALIFKIKNLEQGSISSLVSSKAIIIHSHICCGICASTHFLLELFFDFVFVAILLIDLSNSEKLLFVIGGK